MKILIFWAVTVLSAVAQDTFKIETFSIDGKTYHGVTISKINALEAKIIHADGTRRVFISNLPMDIQKHFSFDHNAAQAALQSQRENAEKSIANAARKKLMANTKPVKYVVWQNTEKGLLVEIHKEIIAKTIIPNASATARGNEVKPIYITEWVGSEKFAFIPHTEKTRKMTNDQVIYAKTLLTGKTQRLSDQDVYPVLEILEIDHP